jgi:DNA-binding transcriptional regulator YhcF (GntR family)
MYNRVAPTSHTRTQRSKKSARVARTALPAWIVDACHLEHDKPSHLAALMSVALGYLAHGRTHTEFAAQAEELAKAAARDDKRPNTWAKKLHRAWAKAQARHSESPTTFDAFAIIRNLDAIRTQADSEAWSGQAGNGTRAVLEGVLTLARNRRTQRLALSVRAVSEAAGVSKNTAARGLHRLTERGYLELAEKAQGEKAAIYVLRNRDVDGTRGIPLTGGESVSHLGTHLGTFLTLDAFAPKALGRTAARVFAALDELEAQSPAEIAARLGLTVRTIRRTLVEMEAVGIVQRHTQAQGYAWTARLDAFDADEIARTAGTHGHSDTRRKAYELERQGYAEYRERIELRRQERLRAWATKRRPQPPAPRLRATA